MAAVSFLLFLLLVIHTLAADESTIALFASPSKTTALLQWIRDNAASLDYANLVAPASIVLLMKLDLQVSWRKVEAISEGSANGGDSGVEDIIVANQLLEHKVHGVVYFYDGSNSAQLDVLARACNKAQAPLAINEETANLALRGVVKTQMAYLIFNPVAGQGDADAQLKQIRTMLEPRFILHVVMTQRDRECADQVREVINVIKASPEYEENIESIIVIASGGDGTVSVCILMNNKSRFYSGYAYQLTILFSFTTIQAVAGETMGTGIPFGVIPRGTANAFSVALGIPIPIVDACHNILEHNVRIIDGAQCNDVPMILLAGLGFEAGMVDNASRELKNVLGTLAYVLGGAKQVIDQQPFQCRVNIDGKSHELEATGITVANVAPPTSVMAQGFGVVIPDDGLLDVTIVTPNNLFKGIADLASLVQSAVVKAPTDSDTILCVHAKTLTVDCNPPQKVVIDGELLNLNPVNFTIVPGGLKVLAPKQN